MAKYTNLSQYNSFVSFAVEILTAWRPHVKLLDKELSIRFAETSGNQKASRYFHQRTSLTIKDETLPSSWTQYR